MTKQPPARLNADMLLRKDEVPETVKPPEATFKEMRAYISYRPKQSVYEVLRNTSFSERKTLQALLDEAVDLWREHRNL